jgi:hypothetical protein
MKVESDPILTTGLAGELAFRLERKIFPKRNSGSEPYGPLT